MERSEGTLASSIRLCNPLPSVCMCVAVNDHSHIGTTIQARCGTHLVGVDHSVGVVMHHGMLVNPCEDVPTSSGACMTK
jgi:hypothetical protein